MTRLANRRAGRGVRRESQHPPARGSGISNTSARGVSDTATNRGFHSQPTRGFREETTASKGNVGAQVVHGLQKTLRERLVNPVRDPLRVVQRRHTYVRSVAGLLCLVVVLATAACGGGGAGGGGGNATGPVTAQRAFIPATPSSSEDVINVSTAGGTVVVIEFGPESVDTDVVEVAIESFSGEVVETTTMGFAGEGRWLSIQAISSVSLGSSSCASLRASSMNSRPSGRFPLSPFKNAQPSPESQVVTSRRSRCGSGVEASSRFNRARGVLSLTSRRPSRKAEYTAAMSCASLGCVGLMAAHLVHTARIPMGEPPRVRRRLV